MTNKIAKTNTFILSNMAPQYVAHNSGPWNNWEKYTRYKAEEKKVLIVITGVTNGLTKFVEKYIKTHISDVSVILQNEKHPSCNTRKVVQTACVV